MLLHIHMDVQRRQTLLSPTFTNFWAVIVTFYQIPTKLPKFLSWNCPTFTISKKIGRLLNPLSSHLVRLWTNAIMSKTDLL